MNFFSQLHTLLKYKSITHKETENPFLNIDGLYDMCSTYSGGVMKH